MVHYVIIIAGYGIYFFIMGAIISYFVDAIPPALDTEKSYIMIWLEIIGQIALLAIVSHYAITYFKHTKFLLDFFTIRNGKLKNTIIRNSGNIIIPFAILLFQQNLNDKILHVKYKINEILVNIGLLEGEPTGPIGSGMWIGKKPYSARPHIYNIF